MIARAPVISASLAVLFLAAAALTGAPVMAQQPVASTSPTSPTTAASQSDGKQYQAVQLRALDKVTARSQLLEIPLGEEAGFGALRIIPRHCFVSASDKLPEQAVFLDISESRGDTLSPARLFSGWMFASSPALSALQHPVYDLTMVACTQPASAKPAAK